MASGRAGLAPQAPRAYLPGMAFFSRFAPLRAYRDLRFFLASRQPYELGFLALAMGVTSFFVYAFARDSYAEPTYRPDIIYVEQYTLSRTDAEIRAAQKVNQAAKDRRLAEQKAAQEKTQAEFKKVDDQLKKWGI